MKWNLTDIFKNKQEFEKEKQLMLKNIGKIENYQGILCDSSNNLYECYNLYEIILKQFEKIYSYGMLNYHLDMANQDSIKLFKDVENLGTILSSKTSFISPEINVNNEEVISQFLIENELLEPYKRDILDTLDKKKHILNKETEKLLSNFQEIFSAPENTFDILTNAEFKYEDLIDEEGNSVEVTDSNYSLFLRSKSEKVRKQAFLIVSKKYSEFINTITELYLANVKKNAVISKLRNYDSGLQKAVINDDASIMVYDSLIKAINSGVSSNHEFIKLKGKLLSKDDIHIYDLYLNPFEKKKELVTYEEAKKEVLDSLAILRQRLY